jgi:hypothetical protein
MSPRSPLAPEDAALDAAKPAEGSTGKVLVELVGLMAIIDSYERKRTNRRNIVIYTRPNRDIDLFCLASKVMISTLPWAARHKSCAAAKPRHRGEHRAQPLRVIVVGVGRCVMIGAHVQREGWEAFGGDCRMAGRQLPAGCHV